MIRGVKGTLVCCLAVVGVLGAFGCAPNIADQPAAPSVAPTATSSSSANRSVSPSSTTAAATSIYGPLWDVFNGGTDFVTAETAKTKAADNFLIACMKAEGFRYTTPPVDTDEVRITGLELAFRTRIADDSSRAKTGYGVTTHLVKAGYEDPAAPPSGRELLGSTAEQDAFDKAESECGRKMAYELLPGDLTDQLWRDSEPVSARVLADPEVVNAEKEWRNCMSESGYAFTSMDDPSTQLEQESRNVTAGSSAAIRLHQKELRLAETDWQCRVANVNDVYLRVRDREESSFLEEHFEKVNTLRERMRGIIVG